MYLTFMNENSTQINQSLVQNSIGGLEFLYGNNINNVNYILAQHQNYAVESLLKHDLCPFE